jgi:hypothetical protein
MVFNYNFALKLIFLIIFILLTIYLIYQEYKLNDKLNLQNEGLIKQSTYRYNKFFKDLFLVVLPAGMAYHTYYREHINILKSKNEINDSKKELTESKELNESLKSERDIALDKVNKVEIEINKIENSFNSLKALEKKKEQLTDILNKKSSGKNLSLEEQNILDQKDKIIKQIENNMSSLNISIENIKNIKTDIDDLNISKSGVWLSDFDFQKFLASLSKEELLAFGGLLFNSLILSYTISIILVLYGDYLIKRFDLENKYPKLAKLIKIRRQMQNYYLKVCFAWIFICLLPQFFIYISILLPRIIELLS